MKAVGYIEGDGVRWLRDKMPEQNTTLFVEVPEDLEKGEPIGYTLEPIYAPGKGYITTHAFILCSSCGSAISGSGGPKYNAVCLKCVDQLDLLNKLKR